MDSFPGFLKELAPYVIVVGYADWNDEIGDMVITHPLPSYSY